VAAIRLQTISTAVHYGSWFTVRPARALAEPSSPAQPQVRENLGMWKLAVPWWELIFRGSIVYVFMLALLRLTGKRQVGQLAPFDLVILLVLSNAVQNSMKAGDNSLLG
jgi:hypothetical protein